MNRGVAKVLIFGGTGGLGTKMVSQLKSSEYLVTPLGSKDANVTNFEEVKKVVDFFAPDVVISLVGMNADGFLHKMGANETSREAAIRALEVNTVGSLNIVMAALPHMRQQNYGRIILASSVLTKKPVVGTGVYASSKAFIEGLARSCALENAGKNITCNALRMGYFDGGLTHKIPAPHRENVLKGIPLGRWGTIEELCNAIRFIINTPYLTGTSLEIDGGLQ